LIRPLERSFLLSMTEKGEKRTHWPWAVLLILEGEGKNTEKKKTHEKNGYGEKPHGRRSTGVSNTSTGMEKWGRNGAFMARGNSPKRWTGEAVVS